MWGTNANNFQPLRSAISSPSCLPLYLSRNPRAKLSLNLPRRNRGTTLQHGDMFAETHPQRQCRPTQPNIAKQVPHFWSGEDVVGDLSLTGPLILGTVICWAWCEEQLERKRPPIEQLAQQLCKLKTKRILASLPECGSQVALLRIPDPATKL